MDTRAYRTVKVERGPNGWGGPLLIHPTPERNKIVAVTGGNIPELARLLAEMTGGVLVDGFRTPPPESEMAAVVIDCGGTARCGVYPRKKIPTINLTSVGQSGPLAQFITEDTYVSGVTPENLTAVEDDAVGAVGARAAASPAATSPFAAPAGIVGAATREAEHSRGL
jgi:PTS system glucitol/sorbitol-specific IIB component